MKEVGCFQVEWHQTKNDDSMWLQENEDTFLHEIENIEVKGFGTFKTPKCIPTLRSLESSSILQLLNKVCGINPYQIKPFFNHCKGLKNYDTLMGQIAKRADPYKVGSWIVKMIFSQLFDVLKGHIIID